MIWFRQPVLNVVPMIEHVERIGVPTRRWSKTILR